jgi:DnaJ-class molecular chaperone
MASHYEILGVSKTASLDEIRNAYRKLARELHPDLNPGQPEKEARFKEISNAYGVLSDERQRARYDHELSRPFPRPQWRPPPQEASVPAEERGRATRASFFWQYGERKRKEREQQAGRQAPPWMQGSPTSQENPQVFYTMGNPFEDPSSFTIAPPFDMGKPLKVVQPPNPQPGQSVPVMPHPQFGPIPGFFWRKPGT